MHAKNQCFTVADVMCSVILSNIVYLFAMITRQTEVLSGCYEDRRLQCLPLCRLYGLRYQRSISLPGALAPALSTDLR